MRKLAAFVALVVLACGGDTPTQAGGGDDIAPADAEPASIKVVEGASQSVRVSNAADTVVVEVLDDLGDPIPQKTVSFEVLGGDGKSSMHYCGSWAVSALETSDLGEAFNVPKSGTVAHTRAPDCTFRVVHSLGGRALADTVQLTVKPGAVAGLIDGPGDRATFRDREPPAKVVSPIVDGLGNPIPYTLTLVDGPFSVSPDSATHVHEIDTTASVGYGTVRATHADTLVMEGVVGWDSRESQALLCLQWGRDSTSTECDRENTAD